MATLNPDPELDRLVRELNDAGPGAEPEPEGPPEGRRLEVEEGSALDPLLRELVHRGGSDLHLVPGAPPAIREHGELRVVPGPAPTSAAVWAAFEPYLSARHRSSLEQGGAADLTVRLGGEGGPRARFRVNLHRQRGGFAAAVRALPADIPTLSGLNLPPTLADVVRPRRGLVLVCGATGAGKSSTLAALVGEINRTRAAHVITIEEPVEFEHRNERAVIEHVEIGTDSPSFPAALRASLRQDPDVVLVGEMRDLETIATAITAAETGHLVLATLHTADAVQAVHRIVDVFPAGQQGQVRQQLALALQGIVSQQLVPRADGRGRVPAVEVLLATYAVRNHIRQERLQNLYNEMVLGQRAGMITLEASLARLVREGLVRREEAEVRAGRPDELASLLAASR